MRRGIPQIDLQRLGAGLAGQPVALRVLVFALRLASHCEHLHRQVLAGLRIEQTRRLEDAGIPVRECLHTTFDTDHDTTRRYMKAMAVALAEDRRFFSVFFRTCIEALEAIATPQLLRAMSVAIRIDEQEAHAEVRVTRELAQA